jgi:hypothetical protein
MVKNDTVQVTVDMPPAQAETLAYWLRRLEPADITHAANKYGVLADVLKSALDKVQNALVDAVLRPRQSGKEG